MTVTTTVPAPLPSTADSAIGEQLATLVPYGRHGWAWFGAALLRSTGFPADGLDLLDAPEIAALADDAEAGRITLAAFADRFDTAAARVSTQLSSLVGNPRLELAMTWQNPAAWRMVQSLGTPGRATSDRRKKERQLALYWQRYCAKAETIGFFGPFAWATVESGGPALQCQAGTSLVRSSHTAFEAWLVIELGRHLARRREVQWWFPPILSPAVRLDETASTLVVPGQPPARLRADDVAVLRLADGTRPAAVIAEQSGIDPQRVRKVLQAHLRRRTVIWDANVPVSVRAWETFTSRVAAIGDETLRTELTGLVGQFDAALAAVSGSADATELRPALAALDALFAATTGASATRAGGQAYAARTLCYSDSTRDVDARVGTSLLDAIDEPLSLVLRSADWFADRLARGYCEAIAALVRNHQLHHGGGPVQVSDIWSQTMSLFWGEHPRPLGEAAADLSQRWTTVLGGAGADTPGDDGFRVQVSAESLRDAVAQQFPACTPMPELAIHSPDLQLIADSVDAVAAGDVTVVLGELHACLASFEMPFLEFSLPGGQVRDRINQALGLERLVPLFPEGWKRNTGRMVPASLGPGDRAIGFTRAAATDRATVWSMVDLTIVDAPLDDHTTLTAAADGLQVVAPDGSRWDLAQVWAVPISMVAADAFKVGLGGAHTPRLTIDNLVLFRETWHVPTGTLDLRATTDRHLDHLAVRRWQQDAGLPDQAFVKFPSEIKPLFVSFTSPPMVATLAAMVRSQRAGHGPQHVVVSEALPHPRQSWLTDAEGRRYVHEFRLQLTRTCGGVR